MKRVSITTALTVAGVLTAGSAAALVNMRVLDSSEGQAVSANRVQLDDAGTWDAPPMASPQLATTVPAADPLTTATTTTPVVTDSVDVDAPSMVTDHDDADPAASDRARTRTPADAGATTATEATTPVATTPSADEQVTGTLPPPYPPATAPTPATSDPTTTSLPRPSAPTTSTTAPSTSRPSRPSTTPPPSTAPPDD